MQSPPSAFAASLGPYRITSSSKERGDTWRRLLKLRQARKDKEEAEVLDLICYAQHLLNRKKEIEMAMKKLHHAYGLANVSNKVWFWSSAMLGMFPPTEK